MSNPLNTIQIIDSLAVGGSEMMAVNIANGLCKHVATSHLCVTRSEGLLKEKIEKEVGYIFLNKQGVIDFKALLKLNKYIKTHHISIIHAHSSSFLIAILIKILIPKIKIVWHDHYGKAEEIDQRKSIALKITSLFFFQIISVNQILVNWAKQNLHCKKVLFIANFAVLNKTTNKTKLKGVKGKRIVCVASFRPQKDHINLLQAFVILRSKYPEWSLHLVGKKHKDIYANLVDDFIIKERLEKHVYFYGSCLDIKNILNQSNIGVLSSNSEGLPVSLLEYGLAGLPVVTTDVGDCNKVIGIKGVVVEKENSIALAIAIEKYILDESLRNIKATQFQKHIFENYSKEAYFSKLINVYKGC